MANDSKGMGIPLPADNTPIAQFPKVARSMGEKIAEILSGGITPALEAAIVAGAGPAIDEQISRRGLLESDPIGAGDPVFSITDESGGRSWLEISASGAPTQHAADLAAPLLAEPVAEQLGMSELSPATGYAFAVTDEAGRFGAGLTLDGRWITNEDPAADTTGTPISAGEYLITREVIDGVSVLYSEHTKTGRRRQLTPAGENAKDPRPDARGNVLYLAGAGETWAPRYVPAAGGTPAAVFPEQIAAWGDSLTYSNNGYWPKKLAAALGVPVANLGVSGERAEGIAARQGGIRRRLIPAGGRIPAAGPVDVTADGVFVRPNQYQAAGTMAGTLAGVHGTLSAAVDSSGVWQFTRDTAGAEVATTGAEWISDDSKTYRDALQIIWAGRNAFPGDIDGPDGDAAGAAVRAMVQNTAAYSSRFVILTVINGENEGRGSAGHTAVQSFAAWAKATYPDNTLDIRRRLIDRGLTLAGITPTVQDLADVAADTVPASLRRDYVHLTDAGYGLVAAALAEFITAKGWL